MRVIDGMHRMHAAALRGENDIAVRFLDGSTSDVFVVAVQMNTKHGLPLTRAERNSAATRIIQSHPNWSDRMIAAFAGLSPKTVGAIRRRLGDHLPQSSVRIGHDGRVRPVDTVHVRASVEEFMRADPQAALSRVAEELGVSRATARDVRRRMAESAARRELETAAPDQPGLETDKAVGQPDQSKGRTTDSARGKEHAQTPANFAADLLPALRRDPSIRFTDQGRLLLRLLGAATLGPDEWEQLIEGVPAHCVGMVASVARACGEAWLSVAQRMDGRSSRP
ncbi:hypothetical protein ACIQVL_47220 [Streptomyces sp. NPDC090499]|uniref:hypothetical protein n=1 Tax=Streptomyces sp. NPDC090499 TaxID=3365965 RepID=UPI00380F264B